MSQKRRVSKEQVDPATEEASRNPPHVLEGHLWVRANRDTVVGGTIMAEGTEAFVRDTDAARTALEDGSIDLAKSA